MIWLLCLLLTLVVSIHNPLVELVYLPAVHAGSHAVDADPVLIAVGDIASCNLTHDTDTAALVDKMDGTIVTLGDNAYPEGTFEQFTECYAPTWGRHKARTRPSPGNHDYRTPGAAGYYTYFGAAASPLDSGCTQECKGYYSYELGAWHIIALNSEIDMSEDSEQLQWLRADLEAHPSLCTLAYWHRPRFSSGKHGNSSRTRPLWEVLYDYGADVVLGGHEHSYERFVPQTPEGQADPDHGIREFVVGTGGAGLYKMESIRPNSGVRNSDTWGVLRLTLHATSYDWEFVPVAGQTFTDRGSAECVGSGSNTLEPSPTMTATAEVTTTMPISTGTPVLTPLPAETGGDILFVGSASGGKAGEINFNDEDLLAYAMQTEEWLSYFKGADVSAGVDTDAFAQLADGSLLFSLEMDSNLGVLGPVDDSDILRFVPAAVDTGVAGTLEWYFDGSDVGLDRNDEDLDALAILRDGRFVVSTRDSFELSGLSGGGEDLIAFTPSKLGRTTEGTWSLYLDGADAGLHSANGEDIKALWIDPDNGDLYMVTSGDFAVAGVSGASSDIFICSPRSSGEVTRCTFRIYWRGLENGFENEEIDAIDLRRTAQP